MQLKFQLLDTFLNTHQQYWRCDPFYLCQSECSPWAKIHPQMDDWLFGLSELDIQELKESPQQLLVHIVAFLPSLSTLNTLIELPKEPISGLTLPLGASSGVPGRKLEQILSMGEVALTRSKGKEWLEWCSGKGFLGQVLSQKSLKKVTSFEWQHSLCKSGQHIADTQQLNMEFIQGDAFSDDAKAVFNPNQHAVALHACGDLHVRLLERVAEFQLPAVTISPCCYHLIQGDNYQCLSLSGQRSTLTLSKSELRIPLQETVTGGERVKRHRRLEMTYRLGFNQLLQKECGYSGYEPIPSIKKSLLANGFKSFCLWACEQKGIKLPKIECELKDESSIDFDLYEDLGRQMFWKMERLSLVQQVFRRPLELWLALDKALYLEEQGYDVRVSEFCDKKITPRNILIHGSRSEE